jgi:hypothetical protein
MHNDDIPLTLQAGTRFDELEPFCPHREWPSLDEDGVDRNYSTAAMAAFIFTPTIILCAICAVVYFITKN